MSKLYFIKTDGTVTLVPPEEYGELEHLSPSFEYMRKGIGCDVIEHLDVRYQGQPAHLFFDEEGLLKKSPAPNAKATAIYASSKIRSRDLKGQVVAFKDLNDTPPPPMVLYSIFGTLIVGDAYLWTGDME